MTAPPFSRAHNLSTLAGITHGFFGRQGGVSTGLYESLNIGQGSEDDVQAIHSAANECKSVPPRGFSPVFVFLSLKYWVHLAVDGESIESVGDRH